MNTTFTLQQARDAIAVRSLLALASLFLVAHVLAADEQDLIATLQSTATVPEKWAACQKLRMIGTPKAVPAVASLLTDDRLSQAARHTLEGLPFPEASAALRQALGKTSGVLKAGVIESLGWRGDQDSVAALAPLVSDPDTTVASAAAAALGRIGGPKATATLTTALDQAPESVQPFVREGLLKCAEHLMAGNDNAGAARIYEHVFKSKVPVQVRVAAWRGLVLTDAPHRSERLVQGLEGKDRPIQFAALKLLRALDERDVIHACLTQWDTLPAESQHAILDAQLKLGAEALPTARRAIQSPNLELRIAAWQALGELNDTASI